MTTTSSDSIEATARKIEAVLLNRLAEVGQVTVAGLLGVHESTISRWKDGDLARSAKLLAALGMAPAMADSLVIDPNELLAVETLAFKYLQLKRSEP